MNPRRTLMRAALGAGVAAFAGPLRSHAQAPSPNAPPPAMPRTGLATSITSRLTPLAPDVWAFIQEQGPGQSNYLISNCGLVAGPETLLAIDSTAVPLQAKAFIAAATATTRKRFDRVVLTHEHIDHVLGLSFFGDVEVIAQERCAAQMQKRVASLKPGFWSARPLWAKGDEAFRYVVPTRTYKDALHLQYGRIGVDLIYPGPAHTLGDTLVHLPHEQILFLGDVGFFGVTPLNGSGYVADWIKVCDRILAMERVVTLVPGHGPVGRKRDLADMRDYLALIQGQARRAFDAGVTPGRAAAEIDLGRFAKWTDSERVVENVTRLYSEFAGTIRPESDRAATAAARAEYQALTASRT